MRVPRNARKSVIKSEKNTPSDDFLQSASKNRAPSTVAKEKASNTSKKSPLPQSERNLTPEQTGKKSEQGNHSNQLSAKNKLGPQSKPQSSSKVGVTTPQQTRLDFTAQKMSVKSVDKELLSRGLASGDKEGARRSQPTSTRQSGVKKMAAENEIDPDDLEALLGDENAKVKVTAQKSREPSRKPTPHQGTSGKKEQREVAQEEERKETTGTARQAQAEPEEGKTERKEYSVFEDWRILETVESQVEGDGPKTISRSLWGTIEDPATGRRLLDGRRTVESLRDRYKRYITALDDVAKKEIRDFCAKHSTDEAKRNHSVFKKVGGQRQFAGISAQLNYDPERISRKTPYGTKSKKKSPEKGGNKKEEAKKGRLERDFEEEDIEEDIGEELMQESDLEEDIEQVTQTKTKVIKVTGGAREQGRAILVTENKETIMTGKNKPQGFSMTSTKTEKLKESKKRKAGDNAGLMEAGRREMKQVKHNNDYEDKSLTLNRVFQSRKPKTNAPTFESIMVYVDLDQGFRQFVKQEMEEEEEEEDEVQIRLKHLAMKYKYDLSDVVTAFSQVSCDFDDLEEFLQTGDQRLLWADEEDADLLEDNKKALKYLVQLKGAEKVHKRKEFLLATL